MAERNDKDLWDPAKEIDRTRAQLAAAQTVKDEAIRAAGGYVVDPERAQGCIDELTRITDEVRRSIAAAWRLRFDPPGFDAVSMNVTNAGATMAKRAVDYIATWANQIEATRDALQRQLDAYCAIEQSNAVKRT
ncbi:hypothetical protein [Pseudonocardia sp. GCM10023141]|uniref:hypothetical protein n=1 Tax=Pseudonocardia sp. GCM10023141 TaxID=3252653 RepID=UPI00361CDDCC